MIKCPHRRFLACLLCVLLNFSVGSCTPPQDNSTPRHFGYRIVNTYPHQSTSFTQGLEIHNGIFYEGTGNYGESRLMTVRPDSGEILKEVHLSPRQFGEGITLFKNKIYQLTWKSHVGYVYDKDSFDLLDKFHYTTEGWGLTHNDQYLIMSDGTETLTYLDPNTCEAVRTVTVHSHNDPVSHLNELEYVQGRVYANIWPSDKVAIIDPNSGTLLGLVDMTGLKARHPRGDVLNGIAYDAEAKRLYMTGKYWSELYEIELIPR